MARKRLYKKGGKKQMGGSRLASTLPTKLPTLPGQTDTVATGVTKMIPGVPGDAGQMTLPLTRKETRLGKRELRTQKKKTAAKAAGKSKKAKRLHDKLLKRQMKSIKAGVDVQYPTLKDPEGKISRRKKGGMKKKRGGGVKMYESGGFLSPPSSIDIDNL